MPTWYCAFAHCPGHSSPTHACWMAPAPHVHAPAFSRGSYTVPGLGARKRAVLAAGGNVLDLAIAMLETEDMQATYTYGDGKTDDAANFGIFKQNWMMIRAAASQFRGLSGRDYHRGAVLNTDLRLDIDVLHLSQSFYRLSGGWWAGHRNGASGLAAPGTPDIRRYHFAVSWIRGRLDSDPAHTTDDIRYWVKVPPI